MKVEDLENNAGVRSKIGAIGSENPVFRAFSVI